MRQAINVGSVDNDPSAETVGSAFAKLDLMFRELHQAYVVPNRQALDLDATPASIRASFQAYNTNVTALYAAKSLGTPPTVNVGAVLDDPNADTIRAAFQDVNTATQALYGAETSPRSFFGAQGYGSQTRHAYAGGTTPIVIRVNTLADNTNALTTNADGTRSGSFRTACRSSFPRIIVFEVSGYINLTLDLIRVDTAHSYLWIAGQTAPSPGISLRGNGLQIRGHNVLVQHIRNRTGEENPLVSSGGQGPSCYGIFRETVKSSDNVVFDHLSAAWASDGSYDFVDAGDTTVSNCISAENLRYAGHPRPLLISFSSQRVAVLRTILAHGHNRQPAFNTGAYGASVNNLIYDQYAGAGTLLGNPENDGRFVRASIVGNRYIQGPTPPASGTTLNVITVQSHIASGSQLYRSDNTFVGSRYTGREFVLETGALNPTVSTPPAEAPLTGITVQASTAVEAYVLAMAGARPLDRDAVDTRVIANIAGRTATSTNIQTEADVGGYPTLANNTQAFTLPSNPHTVASNGYTNLENAIHSMGVALVP